MIFADQALAARIESAECRLLAGAAAAAARRRPAAGAFAWGISGGLASYTGPGSPLNKIAGLGFAGAVDEADLDEVELEFARRGAAVQAEVSCLADPSVCALLTGRGYVLRNFENVLGRALPAADAGGQAAGVEITVGRAAALAEWLDVLVAGFAAPDGRGVPSPEEYPREAIAEPIGDLAAGEGFRPYLAYRGDAIAGSAGLRVDAGIAQLCGAATLPAHRRRGVQSALLVRRLADAADLGCDLAVVTTQPGSQSQQNVQRQGFVLLYTRAVLVREP